VREAFRAAAEKAAAAGLSPEEIEELWEACRLREGGLIHARS
jgi:hypothetical protein